MPTRERKNAKKRATRGAAHPEGRGSRRWSERPLDPLDIPDATFGKNPRDLSRAVRRSVARTGMVSTGARGPARAAGTRRISKHAASKRQEKYADAIDELRDTHAGRPEIARNKLRDRMRAPASQGRKGGPGKRRPYPKKTAAR
jgi:hypothetical protein